MKFSIIIPARMSSTRFPGKPLANILGKPMIQWVYERAKQIKKIEDVVVATDSQEIFDSVISFGGKVHLTGSYESGTERVEFVSRYLDSDVIINVQGDEPLIKTEMIETLIKAFNEEGVVMATLKTEINNIDEIDNPNVVKVITDMNNNAIYFSRNPIPYNRDKKQTVKYYKHIGLYAYKKDFLHSIPKMIKPEIESIESLEQLRILWNNYKIKVVETEFMSIGVDLPEHIQIVEKILSEGK